MVYKMHWTWQQTENLSISVSICSSRVEDPLKEMAEYMESSRDEVWEKTSCNKQVTLLVYQEGDQLELLRVVDRGDGTLTPLSESLRWIGFHLRVSLRKGETSCGVPISCMSTLGCQNYLTILTRLTKFHASPLSSPSHLSYIILKLFFLWLIGVI